MGKGGEALKIFKENPVENLPYVFDFERRKDRKQIAEKLLANYFDIKKPYEEQISNFVKVLFILLIL